MKILSLLLVTFFIVSCGNTEKKEMADDVKVVVDSITESGTTMTGEEVEVMDVKTERVKSKAELEHPERFDPVTGASLPDPREK